MTQSIPKASYQRLYEEHLWLESCIKEHEGRIRELALNKKDMENRASIVLNCLQYYEKRENQSNP